MIGENELASWREAKVKLMAALPVAIHEPDMLESKDWVQLGSIVGSVQGIIDAIEALRRELNESSERTLGFVLGALKS